MRRELQRVQGEAKTAVTSVERLTQELQTKQAQVCSLEGQLDAARTLNNKLTQEVKRSAAPVETSLFIKKTFVPGQYPVIKISLGNEFQSIN